MASTSTEPISQPVVFNTQSPYPLPSQKFMIPTTWKRYQLSQLINKALSLTQPVPFDFLIRGEILRGTIAEWCAEKGVGEEETLEVEYIESAMPPQRMSFLPHDDWVSSVSCQIPGYFLTASYDGQLRAFDSSQKIIFGKPAHYAPITSLCVIPKTASENGETSLIATGSHDQTARITELSISPGSPVKARPLASLHLHTGPVSSIASNSTGSHLLTASWDTLLALWDTTIPIEDEISLDAVEGPERKKRRKITAAADEGAERPKRKVPVTVLKSHTGRVSKAIFSNDPMNKSAYSCGLDSTLRSWDVEMGVCTNTITAAERPMLDLALIPDGNAALAASTDRTVALYDLRTSTSTTKGTSFSHPATPSCITTAPTSSSRASSHQFITGAYDGVVRLWDLRSTKSAISRFGVWEGQKKVLSVDWGAGGLVGVGGEGGMEVWRINNGELNDLATA